MQHRYLSSDFFSDFLEKGFSVLNFLLVGIDILGANELDDGGRLQQLGILVLELRVEVWGNFFTS